MKHFFILLLMTLISLSSNADFVYPVGDPDEKPTEDYPNDNGYQITRGFNEEDHTGIDLSNNSEGGDVRSIAEGTVIIRCDAVDPTDKKACSGFGNVLVIQHDLPDDTYYSLYAHLKDGSLLVSEDSPVDAGQIIAEVNCTGYSLGASTCESNGGKGPHLHFAVKKKGQIGCAYVGPDDCKVSRETINDYVDPLNFIENRGPVDEFWYEVRNDFFTGKPSKIREAFARRFRVKEYNCVYEMNSPEDTHKDRHFEWNDDLGFYNWETGTGGIGIDIIDDRVCGVFYDLSDPVIELSCYGSKLTRVNTWAEARAGDNGYCDPFP